MIVRLVLLAELVAITAALAMPDTLQVWALTAFVLAAAALMVAFSAARLPRIRQAAPTRSRRYACGSGALDGPRAIPMPMGTLGNPIWATASTALNEPLGEMITVDTGATMLALAQYCAVLAAALVTAVITLDRNRAAQVLHLMLSITTIATAMWFGKETTGAAGPDGSTIAVLGVLLSCATAIRAIDQLRRHSRPGAIAQAPLPALSAAIIAMLICMAALLIRANAAAIVAALLGSGLLLSVFAIRRWFLGLWGPLVFLQAPPSSS